MIQDRRVYDVASFYILPVRLTTTISGPDPIWTVLPASSHRYTEQVLLYLINVYLFRHRIALLFFHYNYIMTVYMAYNGLIPVMRSHASDISIGGHNPLLWRYPPMFCRTGICIQATCGIGRLVQY